VLAFALIAAGSGYLAYQKWGVAAAQSAEETVQTSVARTGSLVVSASAAGKIIPATEISSGFDENGVLTEVLISVGDKVQTGDVLARLETDQTEEEIALALAEARLNVLTAQQALDDLYANAQVEAAQALKDVEDAQQTLDDLYNSELRVAQAAQTVAEAQDALNSAERNYNGTRMTADDNTIAEAYAELVLATANLKEMQEKFDDYYRKPDDDLEKAAVQLKLSAAQGAYDSAVSYYNAVTSTGSEIDLAQTAADLATAQAQLVEAQKDLEDAQAGPTPGEIALAEANLAAAQARYTTLQNGADPTEVARAEAELASAKAKLAVAEEDRAVLELTAPMDGVVVSIGASEGETIGAGGLITLADLSHPLLEVYLDETDLDKAAVGYEAEVVFDALPDDVYTGHVIQVSPSLETVSNVNAVVMQVQLDGDSYAKPQGLPIGSSATVDVIGGRAENAVIVPVEALREISPGEYAVFVMENDKPRLRLVTVGLMDYTSAVITSGLEAGEIVTTGLVETTSASAGE
jgi:RND family efflux transporter MFP subunit